MKQSDSRTGFAAKNIGVNVADKVLVSLLKFVTKMIFARVLSEEMFGISGLFSNVLGMLALAELGIGNAISFSLYKPIAESNTEKIRSLMALYRKAYRIIALVVLAAGVTLLPFLPSFINGYDGIDYFYFIYLLFLFNMVIEYLFSYKRTFVIASQKNYTIVPIIMATEILTSVLQITVLLTLSHSPFCYLIYLGVQSVLIIVQNIAVNLFLDKKYPLLTGLSRAGKVLPSDFSGIATNVKALLFHKIGGYVVTQTDNILISSICTNGLVLVGHYSNYANMIQSISGIVYMFVGNLSASFGNLIATETPAKRLSVFREVQPFYIFAYGVCTAFFINLFTPFISLSYGEKFLLDTPLMILIVFANFYLLGQTYVLDVIKGAAGLYDKDKWVPIVQAAVNLAVSIGLGNLIGMYGIFIGTLVSTLVVFVSKPMIVYKNVFAESPRSYFISQLYGLLALGVCGGVSFAVCALIPTDGLILRLAVNFAVTALVSAIVFIAFYRNDKYARAFLSRGVFIVGKFFGRGRE